MEELWCLWKNKMKILVRYVTLVIFPSCILAGPLLAPIKYASESIPGWYIVKFKDNVDIDEAIPRLQNVASAFGAGFEVSKRFSHVFPGFSAELSHQSVQLIRRFNFVDFIEEDGIARTEQVGWNLDRIDQRNFPLDQAYSPSHDGNGANIYVLDTGVNINHVDIAGRAFVAYDALGGDGIDCSGHGSHCAGVAGGTTHGVAKGAHLYSVRVLSCSGSGTWSNTIAGMDWIAANAIWPAVVSMSVGGIVEESVDLAAERLVASGIPLVTSAGNDDWDACDYSPARVSEVITVGATREDDRKYFWSNHGYCVDLFAPGVDVVSAWYTDATATRKRSGTSMACPHVSGAIAIMLAQDTTLTPSEISQQLAVEATADVLWDERLGKVVELPEGSPNLLLHIP